MTNQQLAEALISLAREVESLKRECSMDPESPTAIQNGRYMAISYKLRALVEAQQPAPSAAAAEPLHITHGPLMRHAATLLRSRKPAFPEHESVAEELEMAADGHPTPAGDPSPEWLEVARIAMAPTPQADSAPASLAGPMQFGGCPECGSRSCVARECSRTASHKAQAIPGVQAGGFKASQADSQPAPVLDERAEFERWARPRGFDLRRNETLGHYSNIDTLRCCEGWMGRAALPSAIDATPTAASIAWNALRDLTDPLGDAGVKIMGHVRVYAHRQYEAGRAARAPADSVMAPTGGVAEPGWKSEDFEVTHYPPMPTTGLRVGMPTGVKVMHRPTGLFAVSEDERSQHRNRDVAWNKLQEMLSAAPTPPAQAADSVQEDAARVFTYKNKPCDNVTAWRFGEASKEVPMTEQTPTDAARAAQKEGPST